MKKKLLRPYIRFLSVLYMVGGILHVLALFDLIHLGLRFSTMASIWRFWTVFLILFEFAAATGMWLQKTWGVAAFIFVVSVQLVAYLGFMDIFGPQWVLVTLHIITLNLLAIFLKQEKENPSL
jgi:hypothetical protein